MAFIDNIKGRVQAQLRSFVLGKAIPNYTNTYGDYQDTPYTPAALGTYVASSNAVYACSSLRARSLASLPLKFYKKQTDGQKIKVETGPLVDLFDRVNPYWSAQRFIYMSEMSMCLWGKNFWFMEKNGREDGPPLELWWGKPTDVSVIRPDDGTEYISKFVYHAGGNSNNKLEFSPKETVWMRFPNINDEWDGLSPLAASRIAIDTASEGLKANRAMFVNGMNLGGVIMPDGVEFQDEQARKLEENLARRFKGADKAHKWAVLKFKASVQEMGISPKDAEFLGLLGYTLEEVARAYGIPLDLLGGQRTYANVEASRMMLWEHCLIPEATFIAAEIREQVLPYFKEADWCEFDLSDVSVLQDAKASRWTRAKEQISQGAMTINEWRESQNEEPVPWGDVWWVGTTPISDSEGPMSSPDPMLADPSAPAPGADNHPPELPAPGTSDAKPADTAPKSEPVPSDGMAPPDNTPSKPARTETRAMPLYGSPEHRAIWEAFDARTSKLEGRFGEVVAGLFRAQQESVLSKLNPSRAAGDIADNPFNKPEWVKRFREKIRPEIIRIVDLAGSDAIQQLPVKIDFKLTDPNVKRFIEQRAQRFAVEVNNTTWDKLRNSLGEGTAAGESIDKLAARVEATMTLRENQSARVIARTEVVGGSNGGTLLAWQQSGVVKGKQWLATLGDDRTRATHVEAHGQKVGMGEDFSVGDATGPAPGQMGDPAEDIQCRCTMIAVID